MGMISEANAEAIAKKLEKIILCAMKGGQWGSIRSTVRGFAKEELVDWYYSECEGAFSTPNPDILKAFPPKITKEIAH